MSHEVLRLHAQGRQDLRIFFLSWALAEVVHNTQNVVDHLLVPTSV